MLDEVHSSFKTGVSALVKIAGLPPDDRYVHKRVRASPLLGEVEYGASNNVEEYKAADHCDCNDRAVRHMIRSFRNALSAACEPASRGRYLSSNG